MRFLVSGFFGAITGISYRLRMFFIGLTTVALAGSIYWTGDPFKWGPFALPWFSLVTIGVFLAISIPIKWRRLTISRPYFHRRGLGVLFPVAAVAVTVATVFESGFILFATLFTFPFEKGPEFDWTLFLLGATGAISFLVLWVLDRKGWKAARWSYFRAPILMGFLFAALVHVVSTGSQLRANGTTPDLNSQGQASWLFKEPSDEDAISVLEGFFGPRIIAEANAQIAESQGKLYDASKDLNETKKELCNRIAEITKTKNGTSGYNFVESCQLVKKLNIPIIYQKEQNAAKSICKKIDQLEALKSQYANASEALECVSELVQVASDGCASPEACPAPLTGLAPIASVGDQAQEQAPTLVEGTSKPSSESNGSDSENFDLLKAYSILDGYLQAKIVDAVGMVYVFRSDAAAMASSSKNSPTAYFCDQRSPADKAGKRFESWCAPKSALRAAASVVLSPYALQGFVLSIYVTALLLAFRRRDDGDPDLVIAQPREQVAGAARYQSGQKLAVASRSQPARRYGLLDWLELDQLPSIIDPSVGEIDIAEPAPIEPLINPDEIEALDAPIDLDNYRPLDLGENRISFSRENANALNKAWADLNEALKDWARAAEQGASLADDLCKIFGASLKVLLARAPGEISIQHQLPSVVCDDLAAEFRAYESVYFGSSRWDPNAIAEALSKYRRLEISFPNGVSETVDISWLKRLDDKALCVLIALATASSTAAVFKVSPRR